MNDEERAHELIFIFACEKDKDIGSLLKEKAILFG